MNSRSYPAPLTPPPSSHGRRAFTLLELLIVVGIIAILAAIAVPNLLEAQVRAKVSRVKNDLRTLATGIESYSADNNRPPHDGNPGEEHWGWATALKAVTTPIAYLTALPGDTFQDNVFKNTIEAPEGQTYFLNPPDNTIHSYDYGSARWHQVGFDVASTERWNDHFGNSAWKVGSAGPDIRYTTENGSFGFGIPYDPTNGTVSAGDIYRSQARMP